MTNDKGGASRLERAVRKFANHVCLPGEWRYNKIVAEMLHLAKLERGRAFREAVGVAITYQKKTDQHRECISHFTAGVIRDGILALSKAGDTRGRRRR